MKAPSINVTTPVGTLRYPALVKPDTRYETEGVYQTQLIITPGEVADSFEEKLEQIRNEAVAWYRKQDGGKKVKVNPSTKWSRDEAGNLVVKAKLVAHVETKTGKAWDQRPALFDSKGQKLLKTEGLLIGSGTVARLALELRYYNMPSNGAGISVHLRGVQIIELKEYAGKRAEDFGFGAQETGFVQETFENFEEDGETVPAKPASKVKAQDF